MSSRVKYEIEFIENAIEEKAPEDPRQGGFRKVIIAKGTKRKATKASVDFWTSRNKIKVLGRVRDAAPALIPDPFKIIEQPTTLDLASVVARAVGHLERDELGELQKALLDLSAQVAPTDFENAIGSMTKDAAVVLDAALTEAVERRIERGELTIHKGDLLDSLRELLDKSGAK